MKKGKMKKGKMKKGFTLILARSKAAYLLNKNKIK
jgi:hypothetical protein